MLGFVNINKPQGESSSRTVQFVKWTLVKKYGLPKNLKVGHFGTLDPEASGVLPIAIGNACRLFEYSLDKIKVYEAEIVFGLETSTLDIFGEVLSKIDCEVLEDDLNRVITSFPKVYDQIPPNVSATTPTVPYTKPTCAVSRPSPPTSTLSSKKGEAIFTNNASPKR